MRDNPINALRETLRCGFAFRKSRLESLCVLVFGVFVARTVNLSHLACHFPGRARSSSNYRRLQRFFEQVDFDYDRLAEFLVAMMGLQAGPWRLTMDRTNWRLGRRDVNILMIGIVNRAIAIPVCWRVLDKAGNSNTKERIAILEHVLRLFGVDKIASLLADREFIGDAWLAWLQEKAIPFHIRIRSNIKIANTRGRMVKARELFRDLKPGESRILSNARRLSEARKPKARPVFVAALHLKTGELLIVVTNDAPEEALAIYAQRWQIETLFAALKTRGFNLEDTHINCTIFCLSARPRLPQRRRPPCHPPIFCFRFARLILLGLLRLVAQLFALSFRRRFFVRLVGPWRKGERLFFRGEGQIDYDLLEVAGQIAAEAGQPVVRVAGKQAGEKLEHDDSEGDDPRHIESHGQNDHEEQAEPDFAASDVFLCGPTHSASPIVLFIRDRVHRRRLHVS